MSTKRYLASVAVIVLLPTLAACGGSGRNALAITPSPAGTPADPAVAAIGQLAGASSQTASVTLTGTFTDPSDVPSGVTTSQSGGAGSGVTLSYDASSRSYLVRINQGGINEEIRYRENDRDLTPDRAGFVEYERDGGDGSELLLRAPGAAGSNLSYVSYGIWERDNDASPTADFERWAMFVFGQRTPGSEVPTTGTARYTGNVDGLWTSQTASHRLSGSAQLAANFGTGQVTGTMDISARNRETGQFTSMDQLTGTAAMSRGDAAFAGTLTGANGFTGTWAGLFFGPQAREAGGTFSVSRGTDQAVGVFTAGQ